MRNYAISSYDSFYKLEYQGVEYTPRMTNYNQILPQEYLIFWEEDVNDW